MTRSLALSLAGALAACALSAVPATAKPVCFQVSDGTGDAHAFQAGPSVGSLDIVSADIATGRKNIVAVLRLASLKADPLATTGALYTWSWSLGGLVQAFTLQVYGGNGGQVATFTPDVKSTTTVGTTAILDPATSTITWTLLRKLDPALTPRARLTGLGVSTASSLALSANGSSFSFNSTGADAASGSRPYVDGTATCVKGV